GGVHDGTARRGDVAARHQLRRGEAFAVGAVLAARGAFDAPRLERADAVHLARRAVVGDVERRGADRQIRVAAQVVVGQDDVPQVLAVGGGEPAAPVVRGQAVLAAAGGRFQAAGHVRLEADAAAAERHRIRFLLFALDDAALAAGAAVHP